MRVVILDLAGSNAEPEKTFQTVGLFAPVLCEYTLGISLVAEQVADSVLAKQILLCVSFKIKKNNNKNMLLAQKQRLFPVCH